MSKSAPAVSFEVLLFALLFLCFFQLLTDFVAGVYAFGLLQTRIPSEIACLTLMLAPVVLLFFRTVTTHFVVLTGEWMLLSRLASLALDTRGRMLASGIGTAAFLLFFPALLWHLGRERRRDGGSILGLSLALATLLHVFLRALNSGNDIASAGGWRFLGGALALAAGLLLWIWGRNVRGATALESGTPPAPARTLVWQNAASTDPDSASEPDRSGILRGEARPKGLKWETHALFAALRPRLAGQIAGLCVGMTGVLVMLYFGLAAPSVMARWTDSDYLCITALTVGASAAFLALWLRAPDLRLRLGPGMLLAWNLLFLSALALALGSSRVPFPTEIRAYPLPEPPVGPMGRIGLPLMALLSPILYVNFVRFANALAGLAPSVQALGHGFTLAAVCLLLLIFAQVFTTVYDYVLVIGPWFRDRFWLVLFAAGASATLPILLLRPECANAERARKTVSSTLALAGAVALALGSIGAVALTRARPSLPPPKSLLRVMTFNLQQGYNAGGARNFTGQLELIRRVNPDVVGLQETDTARVAGGNSDLVRFLADRLNYYAHPGPRTGAGTFGIALLSRFPIEQAQTFYLYSTGEQTAVVAAEITVGGTTHHVLVTHLGNGGPIVQQREILELVPRTSNLILIGDFNFRPGSEPSRLTTERLDDAWLTARETRVDPPQLNPDHRIDHVFVSRDTQVRRAEYLDAGASDHPTMVVDLARPP